MKKIWLFFLGLFSLSIGLGFSSSVAGGRKTSNKGKNLAENNITLKEDGTCILGSYPQNIVTNITADEIKTNGELIQTLDGNKYYIYQSKKYAILDEVKIDAVGADGRYLSNGDPVNSYYGKTNVVFEFNDIEWQYLKDGDDNIAYLISTRILDRHFFHVGQQEHISYYDSILYTFLNVSFKDMAFSDEDYNYLAYGSEGKDKVQIDIPTIDDIDIDKYEDKNLKQAGDFAILNNLTSWSAYNHGVGVPYLNAAYWLNNYGQDANKIRVCWAKVAYDQYEMDNQNVGVRPVIQVNYKKGSGGGGGGGSTTPSTPSAPSTASSSGGSNVTLGLGITFTILGAGGLIAFFILWGKKDPKGKPPVWILVSLAGSLIVCVAGFITLPIGILGGAGSTVVGWYQGNMYDCVGFGERLAMNLTKDGKVYRYIADAWEGSAVNYTFHRQAGVGSYTFDAGKLTIVAAPEWNLSSWELPVMVYTEVHGLGSFIKYDGYVGTKYQWYHYSRVDSQGVESITNANTHEGGEINKW